jgi:hypothetical protein
MKEENQQVKQATTSIRLLSQPDERLCPDLLRGRCKLICGDLDVHDEGSKHNFKPL